MRELTAAPPLMGLRFAAVSVAWGGSFLFMKLALEGLGVYQIAFGRNLLGALTLGLLLGITRRSWRVPRGLIKHIIIASLLMNVGPSLLFAWAETEISSSLASIYNATTPLMTLLVAIAALGQKLTRRVAASLATGLIGVFLVASPASVIAGGGSLAGHAACLGATLCYGVAYVYISKYLSAPATDPVVIAAAQLIVASVILLPGLPFLGAQAVTFSAPAVTGILLLGILATGLSYAWNNSLIKHWGPAKTSLTTYVTPVVGLALGALILNEPVGLEQAAGMGLVFASILLGRRGPRPVSARPGRTAKIPAKV